MSSTASRTVLTMSDLFANRTLRSYLSNVRDWHGYIRFLGLPDRRDHPDIIIDRLFVPPLLTDRYVSADDDPADWIGGAETLMTALAIDKPMVLLGDPGTGKSALVNYLVWLLSRPAENGLVARIGWRLPVPMVLRDLRLEGVTDFNGLLQAFLKHAMSSPLRDDTFLHDALVAGQAFILLDGIDEIGDIDIRKKVRRAVFDGFARYPRCRWLLTSRIVGYSEVPFDRHEGGSFDAENAHKIGRMDDLFVKRSRVAFPPEVEMRYIAPFDSPRIKAFARRWYEVREAAAVRAGEDAAHLVKAVHADDGILRLARIPHLLTMMALIHRIEATLPQERALLYDRIAEAYLESIDKFRGIYSGAADLPFKKRWLARVGFEMQRRRAAQNELGRSEILVDAADVLGWVRAEMERHPTSGADTPEKFLQFVKRRSGLLLPRGENRYTFIHLSFQEYFAAHALKREITTPRWIRDGESPLGIQSDSLSDWGSKSAWTETFVFLFEILSSEEDWHDDLRDRIFGKNFSHFWKTTNLAYQLSVLLSRLATYRRSRFTSSKILDTICSQSKDKIRNLILPRLQISDLSPIFYLTSLQYLSLDETQVSDLTPLAYLTSLRHLSLDETQVSDLTPLARLTSLRHLSLNQTQVSDLTPLARLTSLRHLSLNQTQVSDLTPLARLTSLHHLSLNQTQVSDLTPLSARVRLSGTQVPLARLTSLQLLWLNGTQVSDLTPLVHLAFLQSLSLDGTQVSDLTPLARLTSLQSLSLNRTQVFDLTPLACFLRHLSLNQTQVSDITPLARLTSLRSLSLNRTQVSDLTPLACFTTLEFLSLAGTQVSHVTFLARFASLQFLILVGTSVSDLTPLARLNSLRYLLLDDTPVSDLTPIVRLASLEYIDIENTLVSEATFRKLREALPNCRIAYAKPPTS